MFKGCSLLGGPKIRVIGVSICGFRLKASDIEAEKPLKQRSTP